MLKLDKSEYRIKLNEINELAENGDFKGAAAAADEIDWKHVKSVRTLCMIGEIYEADKRYADALALLKYAYRRSSTSKTVLYRLTELELRNGDLDEAKRYATEFEAVSPGDSSRYVLRYRILRAQNAPLDDQIALLKEFKEHEYSERWAYELARCYAKNGQTERCVEECDDMILWFSEGKYVIKAMELKMKFEPLSAAQQIKYDHRFDVRTEEKPEEDRPAVLVAEDTPSVTTEEAIGRMEAAAEAAIGGASEGAENLRTQKASPEKEEDGGSISSKLADSIRQVFAGIRPKEEEGESAPAEEAPAALPEEEDLTVRSLEPEAESVSEEALAREAETVPEPAPEPAYEPASEAGAISFEEFMQPEETAGEFDFEALFRETQAAFANEVASGNYEFADTLAKDRTEEPEKPLPISEAEEHSDLYGKETDESLGLTREFNFREELKKAMNEGKSLSDAAREVSDRAEAEDGVRIYRPQGEKRAPSRPEEAARRAAYRANGRQLTQDLPVEELAEELLPEEEVYGETVYEEIPEEEIAPLEEVPIEKYVPDEIPEELYADEEDTEIPQEAGGDFLSSLSLEAEYEAEKSHSIISSIMEEPVRFTRIPVEPRPLTDLERRAFTYFAPIPGMGEQITMALADVHNNAGDRTSRSGNIMIIGRQGSGKTRMADGLVLAICKELNMEAAKLARVLAEDFNAKDPAAVVKKLSGGFLMIEGAGALSDETVSRLSQAMEFRTDDLIVILEDEKEDLRNLMKKHPLFAEKFSSVITVPVFTNDELVTFAKTYCKELGYKIDDLGTLALYTMIGDNQQAMEPVTVGKVKGMVDRAIERNSRRLHFGRNAATADGRIWLREKDFSF